MDNNIFEDTVSDSKSESILKAISILETENDLRNQRPINRPDINVAQILFKHMLCIGVFALFGMLLFIALKYLNFESVYISILLIVLSLIFLIVRFKSFCIDFILLYQKLAPERLRRSCLFEPSCSEYMLLAIDKYGVFKGVLKGINRLLRCHHPNGGVDYP